MSQSNVSNSLLKEQEIEYDPAFVETHHNEHWIDHGQNAAIYTKEMSEKHEVKDYNPIIGFEKCDKPEYVYFKLPKKGRAAHKHLYYELVGSSAEGGYCSVFEGMIDTGCCYNDITEDEAYARAMSEGMDKSLFEPIIGFSKEDM